MEHKEDKKLEAIKKARKYVAEELKKFKEAVDNYYHMIMHVEDEKLTFDDIPNFVADLLSDIFLFLDDILSNGWNPYCVYYLPPGKCFECEYAPNCILVERIYKDIFNVCKEYASLLRPYKNRMPYKTIK